MHINNRNLICVVFFLGLDFWGRRSNTFFNPYPPFQNFSYWWYRRQGQPLGPHGNKLRWCSGTWRESIKSSLSNPGPKLHHLQQHVDQHVPTSPPLLASRVPDCQFDWVATVLNNLRYLYLNKQQYNIKSEQTSQAFGFWNLYSEVDAHSWQ